MEKDNILRDLREFEELERLNKARERKEREEQKKEDNHWNFVAGSLVSAYLKDYLKIKVYKGKGAKEKNDASFLPLKIIQGIFAITFRCLAKEPFIW